MTERILANVVHAYSDEVYSNILGLEEIIGAVGGIFSSANNKQAALASAISNASTSKRQAQMEIFNNTLNSLKPKSNNTLLFAGIGILVIVIVMFLIFRK